MYVWLLNPFEATPADGSQRTFRMGHLKRQLVDRGHEVLWWTATFFHTTKEQRFAQSVWHEYDDGTRYRYLHCRPYSRNLSLRRLASHQDVADGFEAEAPDCAPPDLIVASFPSLALCDAAARYATARDIPLVIDIRDLWPDAWVDMVPASLRPVARLALRGFSRRAAEVCRAADLIVGINEPFVDWGVELAGRSRRPREQAFPFGYDPAPPPDSELRSARAYWHDMGLGTRADELIICFFGFFSRHFNFAPVIDAARAMEAAGTPVRFVLCGEGDALPGVREASAGLSNLLLPGWADRAQIWSLMQLSGAALAPYRSSSTFLASLPNKSIEYLAAGLPILTSLDGALRRLVEEHDCGVFYSDASSLQSCIGRLAQDTAALERMSSHAADLFGRQFLASNVYGTMADVLESAAHGQES